MRPETALYLLPAVLFVLVLAILFHSRALARESRRCRELAFLGRRAEALRSRSIVRGLRVVPVMQYGQLARPIIVRDWRS